MVSHAHMQTHDLKGPCYSRVRLVELDLDQCWFSFQTTIPLITDSVSADSVFDPAWAPARDVIESAHQSEVLC